MRPLELSQEIERALVAGEPLPAELRDRLSLLGQAIILVADDRRVAPTRAAADAAKLAGLTGDDIAANRLARRARAYGELYQLELRLLAEARARGDKRGGPFTG